MQNPSRLIPLPLHCRMPMSPPLLMRPLAVAGVLALAALACSNNLSALYTAPHPAGSSDASGGEYQGINFKDATCGTCMSTRCRDALAACIADPACARYEACDAQCSPNDVDCESLCVGIAGSNLTGHAPWDLLSCRATQCSGKCGLPCNGACLGNLTCDQCLASQCQDTGRALAMSLEASRALG